MPEAKVERQAKVDPIKRAESALRGLRDRIPDARIVTRIALVALPFFLASCAQVNQVREQPSVPPGIKESAPATLVIPTATPERTATPVIPTATPEIGRAMTAQERTQNVEKVDDLARILEENIQGTIYTPSDRAYYNGLAKLTDKQLAQFLSEHYDYYGAYKVPGVWSDISIGPDKGLKLGISTVYELHIWTNLLDVRDMTLSPLERAKAPRKIISIEEAQRLASKVFILPQGMVWKKALIDGTAPGTVGEYTSPEGKETAVRIIHEDGYVSLHITKPHQGGR